MPFWQETKASLCGRSLWTRPQKESTALTAKPSAWRCHEIMCKIPQWSCWWPTPIISHLPTNSTLVLFPLAMCPPKNFTPPVLLELLVTMWSSCGQHDVGRSSWEEWSFQNKKARLCSPTSACVKCGCNAWYVATVLWPWELMLDAAARGRLGSRWHLWAIAPALTCLPLGFLIGDQNRSLTYLATEGIEVFCVIFSWTHTLTQNKETCLYSTERKGGSKSVGCQGRD